MDDDRYATWDAAYVLGSLSADERREYEAHLETCPRCRAAVAELGGIPPLLAKLDSADVASLDDGGSLMPQLRPQVLDSLLAPRPRAAQALPVGDHRRARRRGGRAGDRFGDRDSPGESWGCRPARNRRRDRRWR